MHALIKNTTLIFICCYCINGLFSCTKAVEKKQGDNTMSTKTIEEVLRENTDELMSIPGVVGTAQTLCDEKPCIMIMVTKLTKELEQKIPKQIEGYVVTIEESGEIKALRKN